MNSLHRSLETLSKYVYFTLQSITIMIDYIKWNIHLNLTKIMKKPVFYFLWNLHGRSTINNKVIHTIEKWKTIHRKLKVVQVYGVFALSLLRDKKIDKSYQPNIDVRLYTKDMLINFYNICQSLWQQISFVSNGIRIIM